MHVGNKDLRADAPKPVAGNGADAQIDPVTACVHEIDAALEKYGCELVGEVVFDGQISYSGGSGTIIRAAPRVVLKRKGNG